MQLKNRFFYTMRENAKDEDSISGNLLVRAGMIKKSSAGVYMIMPMGMKVLSKIEALIREEMDESGAQELLMPSLILEEVYEASGRREAFGQNMFALQDRFKKNYVLGPTHEELFTMAAQMKGASYKDFPYTLYQIQTKYRDETRPRYGLIRVREFIMKDSYSFDTDLAGLEVSYKKMFDAYKNIFDRMGLEYKIVQADMGAMGGMLSEEFQAISEIGEDVLVLCDSCDYASNLEITPVINRVATETPSGNAMEKVHTPQAKTIDEVAAFFGKSADSFVKTLIYQADGQLVAFLLRGNRELNETKAKKLLNVNNLELANFYDVEQLTQAVVGFAGPVNLKCTIVMDAEVSNMADFITGANETDYHFTNVNLSDFTADVVGDIAEVSEGDVCPNCGTHLVFKKGIEVGNTFKLGTKYSESVGLNYLDANNQLHPAMMGCYGIGLGRCMAAIVEQHHDDFGIMWPNAVAPFDLGIVIANSKDEVQNEVGLTLYKTLKQAGYDVLLDDRNERAGVKFKDMELIGLPLRITVGKKAAEGIVEVRGRRESANQEIAIADLPSFLKNWYTK
ncbi:MAG: proline--tRNA ligase [Erysipelotrichaceae bacterium]